jgi:integrase
LQKLTEATVAALEATDRDRIIFDSLLSGFAIRITPAGGRIFIAQARAAGTKRRVTVGTYPEMKVATARDAARAMLDDMRAGKNPVVERAIRREAITAGDITVAALADRWMTEVVRVKRKPRTIFDYERIIEQRIKPELGHIPVRALTWDAVNRFHGSMSRTPRRANYVVSTLRAAFNFAERIGIRPKHSNPCKGVEFFRERMRERFLSEPEIGAAADAIETAERDGVIGPHAAAGLRLALLTGARSGEVTAIRWEHVDWQRKLVRLPDSKTNEARTIHLSGAAIEILHGVPRVGPFVIAGAKDGKSYTNLSRAWIIARQYANLNDVRLHDLRHSYASLAAGRGVSLQMIGKLLGHKVHATTLRYAHLARDQVAAVNDDLGILMQAAIDNRQGAQSANVVRLKQPRKPHKQS